MSWRAQLRLNPKGIGDRGLSTEVVQAVKPFRVVPGPVPLPWSRPPHAGCRGGRMELFSSRLELAIPFKPRCGFGFNFRVTTEVVVGVLMLCDVA